MASMIRTAYPRFKANLNSEELALLYHPDEKELDFIKTHSRGSISSLMLLVLLKSHERLSYFPSLDLIPDSIKNYLAKGSVAKNSFCIFNVKPVSTNIAHECL